MTFKQRAISGLSWSFLDNIANYLIQFIIGIILARLLLPAEFGLVGMVTIFFAVIQIIVDGGFGAALIRKRDATQEQFCTVFYYNITSSVFFYLCLFVLARSVSEFFNEPDLVLIIRVLSISLVISSFSLIQNLILIRNINFKLQTKISVISGIISGIFGIWLAIKGYGVWSLVWKSIIQATLKTLLLCYLIKWRPALLFSFNAFKEMFSFSVKLVISSLINTIYQNVYYLIIGKVYSPSELGYYTRADGFSKLPSSNLTNVIQRVSYPLLATINSDQVKLKSVYKKLVRNSMFISFSAMFGMAAVAHNLVLILIGEKWLPCVPYLQLLCFASVLYPLHALNLNMLILKGKSGLLLRLEIIKKSISLPVLFLGIIYDVSMMITGMIFVSLIAYLLNSYWSGKLIDYPIIEQLKDISSSFFTSLFMGIIVYIIGYCISFDTLIVLLIQVFSGIIVIILLGKTFRIIAFNDLKTIFYDNVLKSAQNNFFKRDNSIHEL